MALCQVTSTNNALSYILRKNPATGMTVKSLRHGYVYGWFTDPATYTAYFQDSDTEVSYPERADEAFEYLNISRFTSPLAFLGVMTTVWDSALKQPLPEDTAGFIHTWTATALHIPHAALITQFTDAFPTITVTTISLAWETYQVTLTTDPSMTLHRFLNIVALLLLYAALETRQPIDWSDDLITKYLGVLDTVDAPFYIRSRFRNQVLTSRDRFAKFQAHLQGHPTKNIILAYGNTAQQRRDALKDWVTFDHPIIDIGCGEGAYVMAWARRLKELPYYAVDRDPAMIDIVMRKAAKAQLTNVICATSIQDILAQEIQGSVTILLTEVLEHMPLDEARTFLTTIVQALPWAKILITTPNAEFNSFYHLTGFRHPDHQWEFSKDEFSQWVGATIGGVSSLSLPIQSHTFGIGDQVNGIHTTTGIVLERVEA